MKMLKNIFIFIFLVIPLFSCSNDSDDMSQELLEDARLIPIIPDIQYYTNDANRFHYLHDIVDYCNKAKDLEFCIQTGDITNNNLPDQWENAYEQFFSRMSKRFPMIYCLGNHDYGDNGYSTTRTSNIPEKLRQVGDIQMEGCSLDNYVRFVQLDGRSFAVLVLEFAPRNEALEWANKIIKEYSNTPFIILTHAFLNNQGKLYDYNDPNCDNDCSQKCYSMSGDYLNDSKEILDKIIYSNINVKIIVCGHSLYKDYIAADYVENEEGNEVPCIMVNYQHAADGGSGYIGVLAIKDEKFMLYSYSTSEKKYKRLFATFAIEN